SANNLKADKKTFYVNGQPLKWSQEDRIINMSMQDDIMTYSVSN
ncbi:31431_t:CDS:1, partial [Gigaspora margarita]